MASKTETGIYDTLLQYHEREPVIANICIIILVITPVFLGTLKYLNAKEKNQIEKHSNILKYKAKMSELDSKREVAAND